jgi:hypothetical protein
MHISVYNGDARASEIRSLKTNQLFGPQDEWTRRSMFQRGLLGQRTFDLPCPINNILANQGSGAKSMWGCRMVVGEELR